MASAERGISGARGGDAVSQDYWEAAASFLLSERARHLKDIQDIDLKLTLITRCRGVDVARLHEADFLNEEAIIG
ncbi:MAG: hypothetical protein M0P29_11110 [Sphaerochaetaceae bacterium]|nr:hypothetical protein [Sphaerochaetaceae bacterium]